MKVNTFPKPGENSPSVTRYHNSKEEAMLAQVLTQLGKMDNKMTEINDHITSLDYRLSEISPRLSVMDSRLSAVDMFITMQRFNQKWKGLEPRLESLNFTEKLTLEDCDVEVNSDCNKTQIKFKHLDEKCSSPLIDQSFANAEESLETSRNSIEKCITDVTNTTGDKIKQVVNNTNSTLSYTSTPVLNNKLGKCAVDFKEEETKPSSNFNSQGLKKQLKINSISTSINSGEENFGNHFNKADLKEKNSNDNYGSNDSQQVNSKLSMCTVNFKKEETKRTPNFKRHMLEDCLLENSTSSSINAGVENVGIYSGVDNFGNCVHKSDTNKKNNANNENNGNQEVNNKLSTCAVEFKKEETKRTPNFKSYWLEHCLLEKNNANNEDNGSQQRNQTKPSGIQTEIDYLQLEQRKGGIKAKGSEVVDFDNIPILPSLQATNAKSDIKDNMLPSPEDGEDDFVIVRDFDIQEIKQAETNLDSEPLKIYHDITEYLEINMGKKKNEVYEFGFEAKDDSFLSFKDNMVINDSKSIKQSSPTLESQIPLIPIPTSQISRESKINETGEKIQDRQTSRI